MVESKSTHSFVHSLIQPVSQPALTIFPALCSEEYVFLWMPCHWTSRNLSIGRDRMRTPIIQSWQPPFILLTASSQHPPSVRPFINMTMLPSCLNFLHGHLRDLRRKVRLLKAACLFLQDLVSACLVNLFPPSCRHVAVVAQSCLTLCSSMDCSTLGFPVLHHLLEFARTLVYCISDVIQPSHPLLPSSPPALNLAQHQGRFQRVGSLH